MRTAALLLAFLSPAASAQVRVDAAAAAAASAPGAASVTSALSAPAVSLTPVPTAVSAPALAPSLSAAAAAPLAPAAGAPAALAPSAIAVIDPASLPDAGRHYTGAEWAQVAASAPDEGARAVLRSMTGGATPELSLKFADGESVSGSFRGIAGGKMAFASGGRLLGVDMNTRDITEVVRHADVLFDGGDLRPEDVVVHSRPAAVREPFKDLAAYKGRWLEIDALDRGDKKRFTAQTISGRLVKADGEEIELDGPKGRSHIFAEDHVVEAVRERFAHYDSRGQVGALSEINARILPGTPVEALILKRAPVSGLFRGVRSDREGAYLLLEVPDSDGSTTMRAYRDVVSVRTPGYRAGELLPGAAPVYAAPGEAK